MKKRTILSIAVAAVLALTAISVPVYAQGVATQSAAKVAKSQKLCRSKKPDGTVKTWTCGTDQPCCVNHFFNLYTCGSQLLQCL